ncbi:MAG TPA: SRPBCC domain-containing protein [Pseudolabrys sp.]|nr:SRPBCC domain-containing protein [Pseudolabrys sp.]
MNRRFKAAPARVYAAWTEPAQIVRWFGPGDTTVIEAVFELHVGGRFMIHGRSAGSGEDHRASGIVQEVVPNRKLVYTWSWQSTPERESLVTVEFKPDGDGTLFTLTHEQFFDEAARDRHNIGWTSAIDKLEAYLA